MDMIEPYDQEIIFIPYDDDSLEQVLSGPKYGQPWEFDIKTDDEEEKLNKVSINFV